MYYSNGKNLKPLDTITNLTSPTLMFLLHLCSSSSITNLTSPITNHKRVGEGDAGPNTGGMGADSPAPVLTPELQSVVMESIILPTVKGMAKEGCKFVGVSYAGLMIKKTSGLPKLIEYNVRFGDPECQVLMMRLESDLAQVLLAACKGKLNGISLEWSPGSAMVVVLASKGYPGSYEKQEETYTTWTKHRTLPPVLKYSMLEQLLMKRLEISLLKRGTSLGLLLGEGILKRLSIEHIKRLTKLNGMGVSTGEIQDGEHCHRNNT